MLPSLVVLLAAMGPALVQTQSPPLPLNLTIYYEALCPDSARFVVQQLAPFWRKSGSTGILTLTFVPWGKASRRDTPSGPSIICQHGPEECWGNRVHGCVLGELQPDGERLEAVTCLMANYSSLRSAAPSCVQVAGLNWTNVSQCAHSNESLQRALQFGRRTNELQPPLTFVPTMTLDGSQDQQNLMMNYLGDFVCDTLQQTRGYRAAGCSNYSA